jgi:hypothetical protein
MKIPNEIISKAMEGGWIPLKSILIKYIDAFEQIDYDTVVFYKGTSPDLGEVLGRISIARSILDYSFWQCLGKAMGWSGEHYTLESGRKEWVYKWHRFIDHLAEGKDIESFFDGLITKE